MPRQAAFDRPGCSGPAAPSGSRESTAGGSNGMAVSGATTSDAASLRNCSAYQASARVRRCLFKFFVLRNIVLQQRQLQWRLRRLRGVGTALTAQWRCTQAKPPAPSSTSAATQVRQWRRSRQRYCTSAMASPAEIAPTPYTPTTRGRDDRAPARGHSPCAPREAGEPGAAQQLRPAATMLQKHSCQRFIGGR